MFQENQIVTEQQVIQKLKKYKSYIHKFNSRTFFIDMESQKTEVWVCSGGGCKTNTFCDMLNKVGIKTHSYGWIDKGCHAFEPVRSSLNQDLQTIRCAIYLYSSDVDFSVTSMHTRDQLPMNYFKMRAWNDTKPYTFIHFLETLEKQIDNWSTNPVTHYHLNYPVILLNTDFLKEPVILKLLHDTLEKILSRPLLDFSYQEKKRTTTQPITHPALEKLKIKIQSLPQFYLFNDLL